ncbi:MAG: hypothetical protein CL933_25120 [Deltaproteobacteria bacterium]|nr:hypothetical protein [Deltaproteobacteria bacterium]
MDEIHDARPCTILSIVAILLIATGCDSGPSGPAPSDAKGPPAASLPATVPAARTALLTGDILDYHGRPLAGATVTARDEGRGMSVSVFTDGHGHYALPPLGVGSWHLFVKIIGSEFGERRIALTENGLDVDFQLRLAEEPHTQLPASYYYDRIQWPTPTMRSNFALACANCHQIGDPLWRKERTQADWEAVVARMEFRGPPLLKEARAMLIPKLVESFGSVGPDAFEIPGPPTGDAVRAILWEYEVDPEGRNGCHDLEIALDGTLYTEDGFSLHPSNLERQYQPVPPGAHSIERAPDGNMWITVTGANLMTKLDVETGNVTNHEHPQIGDDKGVYPHTLRFDRLGRIWYTLTVSNHLNMFDPDTQSFTYHDLPGALDWKGPTPIPIAYGLDVAPDQRVWWSQLLADRIGVFDPTTGEMRHWQSPVRGPRRLRVGGDGVVWVPGYGSSELGRFDPVTETWKVYDLPTKPKGSELPYALSVNRRTGDVWVAGSNSDTLIRFEPESETFTAFPLASSVDFIREIEFDDEDNVWTCVPDRGVGPEGPLSGRFIKLEILPRVGHCGDAEIQLGEQCDDGDTAPGDGCDPNCNLESSRSAFLEWRD